MTEQEMMQEALKWQEHIGKLASDHSDNELYIKRKKVMDWLIQQTERVEELEEELQKFDMEHIVVEEKAHRYKQALKEILTSDECFKGDVLNRMYAMQDKARKALKGEMK